MPVPASPKIYHIVHVSRLASIIEDGGLLCDAEVIRQRKPGEVIGMSSIKQRRLTRLLNSYEDLHVGDCVPFYFCPRSIMLYVIHRANHPELAYKGGQDPIIQLEADLYRTVEWAVASNRRWAYTLSNAGSSYFEDYSSLERLDKIDWNAVHARSWALCKEEKQAEFLLEQSFPLELIARIGVQRRSIYNEVRTQLRNANLRPMLEIRKDWYY